MFVRATDAIRPRKFFAKTPAPSRAATKPPRRGKATRWPKPAARTKSAVCNAAHGYPPASRPANRRYRRQPDNAGERASVLVPSVPVAPKAKPADRFRLPPLTNKLSAHGVMKADNAAQVNQIAQSPDLRQSLPDRADHSPCGKLFSPIMFGLRGRIKHLDWLSTLTTGRFSGRFTAVIPGELSVHGCGASKKTRSEVTRSGTFSGAFMAGRLHCFIATQSDLGLT